LNACNGVTTVPKTNLFDPILSSDSYTGIINENENIVKIEPKLYSFDSDI